MSIYTRIAPQRFTQSKNVGKYNNSGMVFSMINKLDTLGGKTYFSSPNSFLTTTTAGFTLSNYDVSNELISNVSFTPDYANSSNKPTQLQYTVPYNLAPVASAQNDQAIFINASVNNIIRVVFKSNYASATATFRLASDVAFTNTISWSITGTATAVNGVFTTVADLKVGVGSTIVGTPDLTALIRQRFIGINQTAVNLIAPVSVYYAPNATAMAGSVINFKACCLDEPLLKREMDTAELMCGQSTIGETATGDKFTISFTTVEESPDFLALTVGDVASVQSRSVFDHLSGFQIGNSVNKVVGNTLITPLFGQLQLATGLNIQTVVTADCANLQFVPYSASMITTANAGLDNGQYSYDSVTGLMLFNTGNIGQALEITIWVVKDIIVISPAPLKLGHKTQIIMQDVNAEDKTRYWFIKKAQLKFPNMGIEDEGTKNDFEMTCFFGKKGDVELGFTA